MKTTLGLIALFGTYVVVYFLGAFVFWDFNAGNWPTEGRVLAAMVGTIMSTAAAGVAAS